MKIEVNSFGTTKEGKEVKKYTLANDLGNYVSILNYGGIINEIYIPDKSDSVSNIVLGFNTIEEYEQNTSYFGCITGRTAGRISNATFKINDTTYQLARNNGNNNLHGGIKGFDKVIWNVSEIIENDYVGLNLNYLSPHLEEGYPGNLDVYVTYKWDNDNQLAISYKATTDYETPVTLTNHTYFNLSGNLSSTILEHKLLIKADSFVKINEDSIPSDIGTVNGSPFDFRNFKKIGADICSNDKQIIFGKGYDHPFVLNKDEEPQIVLLDEESGRQVSVKTDEECVICYSGNFLTPDMYVYDHLPIQQRSGVCLETQYYPDSLNFKAVKPKTLKPNEVYNQKTTYHFSVIKDL